MSAHVDLGTLSPQARYKLLTAVVVPRPIAWVTTVDADGLVNAAPYSFFNLFGKDPTTVILGLERHHVDWGGDYPVARLFADRCARLVELPRRAIPEPMDEPNP